MVWLSVLIGIILGFVIGGLKGVSDRKPSSPQSSTRGSESTDLLAIGSYDIRDFYLDRRRVHRRRMLGLSGLRKLYRQQQTREVKGRKLVERWRRSIIGLVRLADSNLSGARRYLEMNQYKRVVLAASTSVENISRALIHCFGGKPSSRSGQAEPLRMLSSRFQEEERREFENTINMVTNIHHNHTVLKYLTTNKMENQLFSEAEARQILKSASKIVALFTRIMIHHFGSEIPELVEVCPRCGSTSVSI